MRNRYETDKKDRTFTIVLSTVMLFLLGYFVYGALKKEFWYDEAAIIGFISEGKNIRGILNYYLTIEASNLPLYAIIVTPFYYLLPAKEIWLLLPGILMILWALVVLVRMAYQRNGAIAAYSILICSVVSTTLVNRMGLELRAYGLMFLLSVLTLKRFVLAVENPKWKNIVILTLTGILLMYSHYFGCLCLACLGFLAFIGWIAKKVPFRVVLSIVISVLCFIPWLLATFLTTNVTISSFWIDPPKILQLPETIGYLLGGNYFFCILFGIGFLWALLNICRKKQWFSFETLCLCMIVFVMGGVFFYSKFISPGGGLYENRYFLVILPYIYFILGYGIQNLITVQPNKKMEKGLKTASLIIVGIFMLLGVFTGAKRCFGDTSTQYDYYSKSAEYILNDEQEERPSLLILVGYGAVDEITNMGWYHFYLERQDVSNQLVIITESSGNIDQAVSQYEDSVDRIYVFGDLDYAEYTQNTFYLTKLDGYHKLEVYNREK